MKKLAVVIALLYIIGFAAVIQAMPDGIDIGPAPVSAYANNVINDWSGR